jgi:hypothetical protein
MKLHAIRPSKYRFAGLGVVLAASWGVAQAAGPPPVTRVYVVEVPPAQDHVFNEGMKSWEKCLHDHGAKRAIMAYDAETGDMGRYLFLEPHAAWAEMDTHDPANKACEPTFRSEVLPHFTHGFSEIAELNAKDTYMPGGDADPPPMQWVDVFRIKPGQGEAFHEGLAKFAAAAAKIHWQGHFAGFDIDGSGRGGEDFVLAWPNKSWADVGQQPKPSTKEMMESVYGKAAARANHDKFFGSIAEDWSDAWSYDKDLSYIPGK